MTEPLVSIVLLNYNGRHLLEEYLPSVLDLAYPNFEVIVADNDSSDDSVSYLREQFPEVIIVENDENLGFSAGNNRGGQPQPTIQITCGY